MITDPKAHSLLQFNLLDNELTLLGDFSEGGVSFAVHDFSEIAQFARWYRTIVSPDYKLILYMTSLNHEPIEVTEDMTEADLIVGFDIPFNMDKYE